MPATAGAVPGALTRGGHVGGGAGAGMALGIVVTETWRWASLQALVLGWVAAPMLLAAVATRYVPELLQQLRRAGQVGTPRAQMTLSAALNDTVSGQWGSRGWRGAVAAFDRGMHLVLLGMQNRTFGSYLTAMHRILIFTRACIAR
jgi:hypothetical protein